MMSVGLLVRRFCELASSPWSVAYAQLLILHNFVTLASLAICGFFVARKKTFQLNVRHSKDSQHNIPL